jgi:hypothetical protein
MLVQLVLPSAYYRALSLAVGWDAMAVEIHARLFRGFLINKWWMFDSYSGFWIGTSFIFNNIWDVILPIDELIFFKMVIAPPTSILLYNRLLPLLNPFSCSKKNILLETMVL